MLRISKLSDYATVILSYMAKNNQSVASATLIARELRIGTPTVSKILKKLVEKKLVVSFRGTVGGYQLNQSPETITIAAIIAAVEGPISLTDCSRHDVACTLEDHCQIKGNWRLINNIILKTLNNYTLKDMLSLQVGT
jgi:FeS assembly SUF system regulator